MTGEKVGASVTPEPENGNLHHWDVEAQRNDLSSCPLKDKGATLVWDKLTVTVKDVKGNERHILKGIDGYVEPRSMLAVMGPSGCGKSTLLDALAGRLASSAKLSGDILVNGHKTQLSFGRSAYVTQDEVMIGTLTVRETVRYAAMLRLPRSISREERDQIVSDVLTEMGMDVAADTYIGNWHLRGISGGQRRRVAIATELVTSPKLLFLDEPTSGLDSAAAFYVMSSVKRLADGCRTIVSVIHQPSPETFDLFDQLCLLSDGNVIYFGPARNAGNFFAAAGMPKPDHRSPADHMLHVINRDFAQSETGGDVDSNIKKLVAQYESSTMAASVKDNVAMFKAKPGHPYNPLVQGPGWLNQTTYLTWRTLLNNFRNVGVFWMRLAMYIMLCLCIGFVYFQLGDAWMDVFSRAALLFFVVAFLTFMSIAAFPAFIEDMKVFTRERLNGYYGVSTFTVANTLASLPFIFLIAVISTICVYWLADLRPGAGYVWFFILELFMSLTVVESLMMAIAPLVPHYLMGIAAGAGMMGLMMIVCGFFQPLGSMPKPIFRYPLSYLSYHTYAFTGFMRNEFVGTDGWGSPPGTNVPGGVSGAAVLDYYEIMAIEKWVTFGILSGWALLYRTLFFAILKYREMMKR